MLPVDHAHVSYIKNFYSGLPIFKLGGLFFLMSSCINCWYILHIKPLSVILFADIFSYSVACLFILMLVSFSMQNLLSLIRFHFLTLVFVSFALRDNPLPFLPLSYFSLVWLSICIKQTNLKVLKIIREFYKISLKA